MFTTRQTKMNHSALVGASIHATCEAIIMAKPANKIIGQPTTNLLEKQLAQAAGAVTTNQLGGLFGCIALALPEADY